MTLPVRAMVPRFIKLHRDHKLCFLDTYVLYLRWHLLLSETRIKINGQQSFGTSSGTPGASRDLRPRGFDKASRYGRGEFSLVILAAVTEN
jgi:hypothetical protein